MLIFGCVSVIGGLSCFHSNGGSLTNALNLVRREAVELCEL